jgi:hypothetical protein
MLNKCWLPAAESNLRPPESLLRLGSCCRKLYVYTTTDSPRRLLK